MHLKSPMSFVIFVSLLSCPQVPGQNMRVDVAKRGGRIPPACRTAVHASLEGKIDLPALIHELACKGAGDMLVEYTYVMHVSDREKDKNSNIKEETTTYEVFIPTLKSGMRARGILLITNRNGVPVPPDVLEKERIKTGERLEKEESKTARTVEPPPEANSEDATGMLPVGMYTQASINRGAFGIRRGGVTFGIHDFLVTCDLTFRGREQQNGRDVLAFRFIPRANVELDANRRYMAQLTGEIWVDVQDHIVTRLAGWPNPATATATDTGESRPAVYAEMMRVREGTWLPRQIRINGLDYPKLFDHITDEMTWTYSNYIHFSTEVEEFKTGSPAKP